MTPEDIVARAKELIERDGWVQKTYRKNKDGKCLGRCISGALHDAAEELGIVVTFGWEPNHPTVYHQARDLVNGKLGWKMTTWNDKGGRTKAEVLEILTL